MNEVMVSSATIVFTGGVVLLGLSLLLARSTWRTLILALNQLPKTQRKIIFRLGKIKNKRRKIVEEMKDGLYGGCIFFGLSSAACTVAIAQVAAIMLGANNPDFYSADYNVGRYALLAGVMFFFLGMFSLCTVYLFEAKRLREGKQFLLLARDSSGQSNVR